MDIENMSEDARYAFFLGMNLGFFFKSRELSEDVFMKFCQGIWDTIEMQPDWEKTRDLISDYVAKDIPKKYEEYLKRKDKF